MKITVDVDITPEELRRFLGLPNVEKLQEEMIKNAQKYLQDAGQTQYQDLVNTAMQPMLAYQNWLQRMMTGNDSPETPKTKPRRGSEGKSE